MKTPPKEPHILKVRGNPKPNPRLMVGDVARYERDGWLLDEDGIPMGRLDAMRDLFMYETRHLKGDWIIKGNIPNGVTIEVTGGNLEVQGNLGHGVTLKNSKGFIHFRSADESCSIIASRGAVKFDSVGSDSYISGTEVTANHLGSDTDVYATKGDIHIETADDKVRLDAAKDITLHSIGDDASLVAVGNLTYHHLGANPELAAAEIICTDPAAKPAQPTHKIVMPANQGTVKPTPLCKGVWRDEANKTYILELGAHPGAEASEDFAGLMLALWQNRAQVKQRDPHEGKRQFIVSTGENDLDAERAIQQALDAFIEKQRSRETGPKR